MTRTETTKSFPANCTCHLSEHSKFCPASRTDSANGTRLTPHQLRLVERYDADPLRLAAHLTHENRFHATGHGVSNPAEAAEQWVRNYDAATFAHLTHCRAVLARLDDQLGI